MWEVLKGIDAMEDFDRITPTYVGSTDIRIVLK